MFLLEPGCNWLSSTDRRRRLYFSAAGRSAFRRSESSGPGGNPGRPDSLDDAAAAYKARDYEQAARLFAAAAKEGDPQAENNLATMYLAGLGVKHDPAEAARWFRQSADQGFAPAQVSLGELYFNGLGVPQDDAQAFGWLRRAAERGNTAAENNLGVLYAEGRGVTADPLVNTATLVIEKADLARFFALTGHTPLIVPIPERAAA